MIASAVPKNIKAILKHPQREDKLNILTFTTHERYEQNLSKTGHNFYALNYGKSWDKDYGVIPENYNIINEVPPYLDIDIVLSHTSCDRLQYAHDTLSNTKNAGLSMLAIPILRHTHVLPDIRMDVEQQKSIFQNIPVFANSFISDYSRKKWGYNESNSNVVEHGVDTDFWFPTKDKRDNVCLSVVNDWPNRDWCCGFNLWRQTSYGLPVRVYGKSAGFSYPAESTEHLRDIYSSSLIFYNTSIHSPVPTVLLEAMACGCAIVSTANCMIPEIITHKHDGLISNDPSELRSFLELLLNDNDLARQIGDNARKTIIEKFNLNRFCDNWNNLLYTTIERYKGKI